MTYTATQPAPTYDPLGKRQANRAVASGWISAGQIMITLYAIAGVIGGIAIASVTQGDHYYDETTHPFVGYGLGLVAFAVTTWSVTMAVLAYMAWRVKEAGVTAKAGYRNARRKETDRPSLVTCQH